MPSIDFLLALGGLFAGLVVGLTGMGGAAIVTPMLIFIFGVPASVTVSTDIVSAAAMKPVGAAVHIARRTPHMRMVFWLCVGSVPGVLIGTLLFAQVTEIAGGQLLLRRLVGVALVLSVALSVFRLRLRKYVEANAERRIYLSPRRRALIAAVGLVVGILVGLTSVGSGTLIAASLILMFPSMLPRRLVGTDLVQAVPLLLVGAVAHWGLGEIDLGVLLSLLLGQLPGVWLGARISSRYNGQALRLLLLVLVGTAGLALIGVPAPIMAVITLAGTLAIGIPIVIETIRDRNAAGEDFGDSADQPQPEAPPDASRPVGR